jgi:hypothetical protein
METFDRSETEELPSWVCSGTSEASTAFEIEQRYDWEVLSFDVPFCVETPTKERRSLGPRGGLESAQYRRSQNTKTFFSRTLWSPFAAPPANAVPDQDVSCCHAQTVSPGKRSLTASGLCIVDGANDDNSGAHSSHSCAPPADSSFVRDLYYALKGLELEETDSACFTPTPPSSPILPAMDISLNGACNNDHHFTFSKADADVLENTLTNLARRRKTERREFLQGIMIGSVLQTLRVLMWFLAFWVFKRSMKLILV